MVLISVFLYTVRFPYFKRIDFRTRQVRFSALRRTITGFLEVGVWNRFIGFWINAVGFSTALFLDFHQPRILQLPQGVDRFLPPAAEQSDTSHETNDEEDLPVYGLLKPDRIQLDSLLSEIGCGLVLVDRREWETADSVYVSLVMPYYSHGIVDAGTSKSFVYDPGLRSRRNIRITEHGDLNEIYRRTYNDTTLYKPVKEGWYIELDHSR